MEARVINDEIQPRETEGEMKNLICLWGTMGILALAVAARAADGLTQTLQHGLYEEEANQNLDAAIKAYQSVVVQSTKVTTPGGKKCPEGGEQVTGREPQKGSAAVTL